RRQHLPSRLVRRARALAFDGRITALTPNSSIAEQLAARLDAARANAPAFRDTAQKLLLDVAGLCVAARNTDYVRAAISTWESSGSCTAFGHPRALDSAGAAFVNGTAAHGEDFDDTFEGGPVHAGAVVVPAVLAIAERERLGGSDALAGIAVGAELMCRASLVAPKKIHKAGFHPTAVLGALAAAAGVSVALRLPRAQFVNALGIVGSMASGIIEYLAEGAWTKRLHPGWAAQCGIRAADLARGGFIGPRTVLEGTHGFYHGFAHTTAGDWAKLLDGFGSRWVASSLAFKPYACGTMTQPYVDCARRLAQRIDVDEIDEVVCETAEGIVHRLWEPLADKQRPPNAYAGKFSTPYCIAAGFILGHAGLDAFTEQRVKDEKLRALAAKVRYQIDPANPYPDRFTGHVRVKLRDGRVLEERQAHMRGGVEEPLTRADIEEKFRLNCAYGGWNLAKAEKLLAWTTRAFEERIDLAAFRF
ncbi:MAG TPA: MmgE/PrpD family protein, partial [Burkholderiales bacterium]